jgi:dienelactone hydrolase
VPDVTIGATAAYLAVPSGSAGPWPGVVVSHEAFGLNPDTRAHAEMKPLVALARLQYDKAAAEDAWQRIFAFFGAYLK